MVREPQLLRLLSSLLVGRLRPCREVAVGGMVWRMLNVVLWPLVGMERGRQEHCCVLGIRDQAPRIGLVEESYLFCSVFLERPRS